MEMAKHLQPLIDGNVVPLNKSIDARLNNVQGYLKFAKSIWNGAGGTTNEQAVETETEEEQE